MSPASPGITGNMAPCVLEIIIVPHTCSACHDQKQVKLNLLVVVIDSCIKEKELAR